MGIQSTKIIQSIKKYWINFFQYFNQNTPIIFLILLSRCLKLNLNLEDKQVTSTMSYAIMRKIFWIFNRFHKEVVIKGDQWAIKWTNQPLTSTCLKFDPKILQLITGNPTTNQKSLEYTNQTYMKVVNTPQIIALKHIMQDDFINFISSILYIKYIKKYSIIFFIRNIIYFLWIDHFFWLNIIVRFIIFRLFWIWFIRLEGYFCFLLFYSRRISVYFIVNIISVAPIKYYDFIFHQLIVSAHEGSPELGSNVIIIRLFVKIERFSIIK